MSYRVRKVKGEVVSGDAETARHVTAAQIRYLTSTQVKARYGNLSDMALWRWLADEELAFPKPLVINRRRFWTEASLAAWDARQAAIQATE